MGRRLLQLLLVGLIFAGSLVMALGIPVAGLWAVSRLSDDYFTVYGLALIVCPLAMILWGMGLARLNGIYLRVVERPPRTRAAASTGRRGSPAEPASVLEVSMTVAVLIAVVTFAVWAVFFGWGHSESLGPFPE